jgi:5-methylcytosine-specific restriction endonuclease McrA
MNVEHIIPRSRGGASEYSNLCLSCAWCNSSKWAKTLGMDPQTQQKLPLFHPRQQKWSDISGGVTMESISLD